RTWITYHSRAGHAIRRKAHTVAVPVERPNVPVGALGAARARRARGADRRKGSRLRVGGLLVVLLVVLLLGRLRPRNVTVVPLQIEQAHRGSAEPSAIRAEPAGLRVPAPLVGPVLAVLRGHEPVAHPALAGTVGPLRALVPGRPALAAG